MNNISCYQTLLNKNMKAYSISDDIFVQSLIALKGNIFAESLNWEYERVNDSILGEFMIYCNLSNMDYGTTFSAHMRVEKDISVTDVEKMLLIEDV